MARSLATNRCSFSIQVFIRYAQAGQARSQASAKFKLPVSNHDAESEGASASGPGLFFFTESPGVEGTFVIQVPVFLTVVAAIWSGSSDPQSVRSGRFILITPRNETA